MTETESMGDGFALPNLAFETLDMKAMKTLLDQIDVSAAAVSKSLATGFANASASGKSFNDTLEAIGRSLAKMALRAGAQAVGQGLASGLGAIISNAFGSAGARSVVPFADGGIVASPTYFATSGSVGLMGERGAEAIMPLARGPDGQLGVKMQGRTNGSGVAVTVNIAAQDLDSFRRSEGQIAAALARAVTRGRRNL
jgi:phage-related minor tail protein